MELIGTINITDNLESVSSFIFLHPGSGNPAFLLCFKPVMERLVWTIVG